MKQYKIWNIVKACGGKTTSSDFGANDGFTQTICVGTGSRNPHEFAEITVERDHVGAEAYRFRLYVNDELVKSAIVGGSKYQPI